MLGSTKAANQSKARVMAAPESTPSGASITTVPPSRTPMPLRLIGSNVSSVTVGTRIK